MPIVPDWAPNIHPLIVHFPVAILILAILADLIAQVLKRWSWGHVAVTALYAIGAVAAVVAFLTGRAAADSVDVPASANASLTDHADWGEQTMWFFLVYAGLRFALLQFIPRYGPKITLPLFLVALIGGYLLWGTADRGGKLVYGHGVGVYAAAMQETPEGAEDEGEYRHEDSSDAGEPKEGESGLTVKADGSWSWTPTSPSLPGVRWLAGSGNDLQGTVVNESDGGSAIRIAAFGTPRIFTIGESLASVQIDATVNLDSLDGSLALLHNVRDADTYGFFSIENGAGVLGRSVSGKRTILERENATTGGTMRIRVVADRTHFRGYVNDKLVVHGHGDGLESGEVGIRFQGKGSFVIERIDVQSLR